MEKKKRLNLKELYKETYKIARLKNYIPSAREIQRRLNGQGIEASLKRISIVLRNVKKKFKPRVPYRYRIG